MSANTEYLRDLATLNEIQHYTVQVLEDLEKGFMRFPAYNLTINTRTLDNRNLRVNLLDRQTLANPSRLYFVGFFGQKKPHIGARLQSKIDKFDAVLSRELLRYPSFLAYSTLELPDLYNYANLVVFSQTEDLQTWKANQSHVQATSQISPKYYQNVRIHTGTLENGIRSSFSIERTNFYEFGQPQASRPPLQAVKHSSEFSIELSNPCYNC